MDWAARDRNPAGTTARVKEPPRHLAAAGRYPSVHQQELPAAAAATAAATATAVTATAAAAAAATAARTVLGLVDAEGAAAQFLAVEGLDHRLQGVIVDFDEAEATGTARLAVIDQRHRVNGAMLAEQLGNLVLSRAEGQVAHVQFLHGRLSKCRLSGLQARRAAGHFRRDPLRFHGARPCRTVCPRAGEMVASGPGAGRRTDRRWKQP